MSEFALRVIAELGPWLWMAGGFCMIALEVIFARTFALSSGLAAICTGSIAVLSESGVLPKVTLESQICVWLLLSLVFITGIKRIQKTA